MTDNIVPDQNDFPDPGELPVVDWISKDVIDVDVSYQRGEDMARAEKIARTFSWSKFGAVVLVPREDGRYAIIDGQHRMLAAKLHPLVDNLPAVIMPAVKGTAAEATSFIGLNAERKAVSGLELFHARRATGDEDVQTIDQVLAPCRRYRAALSISEIPARRDDRGQRHPDADQPPRRDASPRISPDPRSGRMRTDIGKPDQGRRAIDDRSGIRRLDRFGGTDGNDRDHGRGRGCRGEAVCRDALCTDVARLGERAVPEGQEAAASRGTLTCDRSQVSCH